MTRSDTNLVMMLAKIGQTTKRVKISQSKSSTYIRATERDSDLVTVYRFECWLYEKSSLSATQSSYRHRPAFDKLEAIPFLTR